MLNKLKNGMVVYLRDGSHYIYLAKALFKRCGDTYTRSVHTSPIRDKYYADLTHRNRPDMDIMKITYDSTLVWKRKEDESQVELTIQDIANKFGVDVRQLRIKEK